MFISWVSLWHNLVSVGPSIWISAGTLTTARIARYMYILYSIMCLVVGTSRSWLVLSQDSMQWGDAFLFFLPSSQTRRCLQLDVTCSILGVCEASYVIRGGIAGGCCGRTRSAVAAIVVVVIVMMMMMMLHSTANAAETGITRTSVDSNALTNARCTPDQHNHRGDQYAQTQSGQEALVQWVHHTVAM